MGRIAEICRKYGVKELSVFGSAARGEMRPDSDLDILVKFLPESKIGWEFFELEEELTRVLARKVDLGSKRSLKPWVRADALRDARMNLRNSWGGRTKPGFCPASRSSLLSSIAW